jgi:murein tripeptide amidase MpaA
VIAVETIGYSVEGRPINAHKFKNGPRKIIIVGGIHGGYEWNSILLAHSAIKYFEAHPEQVPDEVSLTIIRSANPDGQALVTGAVDLFTPSDDITDTFFGRFNANGVDLNRNWGCEWRPTALWRNEPVNPGESAFSEPETMALHDFFLRKQPEVVIFLHSAANGVFASGCPDTHGPSLELAQLYGDAAGYPVNDGFSAYPITGDAGDWLTTMNIPSFSVELINHQNPELDRNLAGMLAILNNK